MSLHEEFLRWDQTNPDDLGLLLTQQPEPLAHASLQLPPLDLFPPPLGNKPSERIPSMVSILSQRNFYDCSKVEATFSVMKSRLACVRFAQEIFPAATREEATVTLEHIMDRLSAIRKCVHGGCGIPLKCATYFTFSGQTWFGLVADGAQLFRKWHQVCSIPLLLSPAVFRDTRNHSRFSTASTPPRSRYSTARAFTPRTASWPSSRCFRACPSRSSC